MRFKVLSWVLVFFFLAGWAAHAQEVNIGVLAKRGMQMGLMKWQPTADYLQRHVLGYRFVIVPLSFDAVDLAVRQKRIDFIIANPAYYVKLESLYGINRIATLNNRHVDNTLTTYFGGVVFTRADNSKLKTFEDLRGARFSAVDRNSLGGWIAAYRELKERKIDPFRDFASLEFVGTHDEVLRAVLSGSADAGTVRTDTLERMQAEGNIDIRDLYVINEHKDDAFAFLHSTRLYPEWPIARLSHTDRELAKKVALALMEMASNDPAALASVSGGWTIPSNYQSVRETLKILELDPYAPKPGAVFFKLLERYWPFVLLGVLCVLAVAAVSAYVVRLNYSLRQSRRELVETNRDLESKIAERTQSIEAYLHKERYLRSIMSTVSDINSYLIMHPRLEDLLAASCKRLVRPASYALSFILVTDQQPREWFARFSVDHLEIFAESLKTFFASKENVLVDDILAMRRENVINDLETFDIDEAFRRMAVAEGLKACILLPLSASTESVPIGVMGLFTLQEGGFEIEEIDMLKELAGDLGFAVYARRQEAAREALSLQQVQNYEETIVAFVKMIEERDTYTAGHTARVAKYSEMIARQMNIDEGRIEKLKKAAIIHDIGKVSTPDAVLLKPGRLNELEYSMIKEHVGVGYEMLKNIKIYEDLVEIMRHHHEHYDGSGYPDGLRGEQIPLLSAVMSVADAFDAMISRRIYKKRKSVADALLELELCKGMQFHPEVVDAALIALKGVDPEEGSVQFAQTEIERERLAYFYKDPVTGAYNEDYLHLMQNQSGFAGEYPHRVSFSLDNFDAYVDAFGIRGSERMLKRIAEVFDTCKRQKFLFFCKPSTFTLFLAQSISQEEIDVLREQIERHGGCATCRWDFKTEG